MTLKRKFSDKETVYYDYSVWKLEREKLVISKGPGEINKLACPHCGGTLDDNQEKKCAYCGQQFKPGKDTWALSTIVAHKRSKLSPKVSTEYAVEQGTRAPTIFQPDLADKYAAFQQKYPDFNESRFLERVKFIFEMLQKAWSSREWEYARPFETDSLFQVHLYWINRYKQERIQNVLEDIHIDKMELVKLMRDYYYDAFTVRIHAAMIDYTINDKGKLLGGDRGKPRPFTEYWTFIRRAEVKEKESKNYQCPNCGNSLKVGMMGKCSHCDTKITNGDFDWVLSMIEQDESYTG
jgi:ribosomal protein L37AE/L43A